MLGRDGPRPRTLEEALKLIEPLLQINAQLQARVAELGAKVAALEEQLRQTSQNSSRPRGQEVPTLFLRFPHGR